MGEPISAPRAALLLARLRLRRWLNRIESIYRYRIGSPERKAGSRTSPAVWIVSALVVLSMLGTSGNLAYRSITNLHQVLGSVEIHDDDPPGRDGTSAASPDAAPADPSPRSLRRVPPAPHSTLAYGVLQGAALEAMLLLIAALLLTLAGREIVRAEWDLEWLATLPLPLSTLVLSRLTERAVTGSYAIIALAPFLTVLAWTCGYRWSAPVLGVLMALPLLFLVACVHTLVDTGLRLALAPARLKNIQAALSLASMLPLLVAMSASLPGNSVVFTWASMLPEAMQWSPTGLAVRAIAASDLRSTLILAVVLTAEAVTLVALGMALLQHQLRDGVVAAGAREAVPRRVRTVPRNVSDPASHGRAWLSAVPRRELRLLKRDRTFMVQTLLLPAVIVGGQVVISMGNGLFVGASEDFSSVAAIAFALAAYTLMFSAFQTVNAEGPALWILYCVPH